MFQGMFRKRGRPPDPLPIGGYDMSSNEEDSQIPVHQLLEAPGQLPLPSVRELESNVVVQQERNEGNNELAQPSLSQSSQNVDNIESLQERSLALNPQQIHILDSKVDTDAVLNGHKISEHFLSRMILRSIDFDIYHANEVHSWS